MKEWIITSNLNRFDVIGAFKKIYKINREQKIKVEPGDIVYIYISEPVSAIKYKCVVTKVDLPHPTVDNSEFIVDGIGRENVEKYMELQLLERLDNPAFAYDRLKENGLKAVQGPSKVTSQLSQYIHVSATEIIDKEAEKLIAENDENIHGRKYGNTSEMNKIAKEEQKERDKNYPKDYVVKIGVTIDQWKELLQNQEIFLEKDLDLMKRIYLSENHAATCYELGLQDGVSPSTYIKPVVALGRRISRQLELNPIIRPDGSEAWWCIPFWGSYREDNHFEWKIRPKLAKALVSVFPELELLKSEDHEEDEDDNLVEDLKNVVVKKLEAGYEYKGKPKKKKAPIYSKGRKTYLRDRQTALNALAHAEYKCEIDLDHPTFKRRKAPDVNYTEPHHLVPMAHSDQFEISLDVEENIVSLCSNCHNHLHYGQGSEDLLKRLFDERKEDLKRAGIDISFETLMSMY